MHHLFGAEVSEMVKAAYGDAFLTAHLEVSLLATMLRSGAQAVLMLLAFYETARLLLCIWIH